MWASEGAEQKKEGKKMEAQEMIFRAIHWSVNVTMRGNITHVSFNSEKIPTVILLSSSLLVLEMQTCLEQLPASPFFPLQPPPTLPVHKPDGARPGSEDGAQGKVTAIRPAWLCHSGSKGQACSQSFFGPKQLWPSNSRHVP